MLKVFLIILFIIGFSDLQAQLLDELKSDMVKSYDWILNQAASKECKTIESFDINAVEDTPENHCEFLKNIHVYPNPTEGQIEVSFNANKEDTQVIVTSMNGQIIYRKELIGFEGNYKESVNLEDNSKGIYLLSIIQGKEVFNRKIVLQ